MAFKSKSMAKECDAYVMYQFRM